MEDRSNVQKNWYELGPITKTSVGWIIKDLLVRWNEHQEQRSGEGGVEAEYVYDAYRIDYILPIGVQPGTEAVEYYFSLESTKTAIMQLARDLSAQGGGFLGSN